MRKHILYSPIGATLLSFLFVFCSYESNAQIGISLRYSTTDSKYHVFLKPTATPIGSNPYLTDGSSTITVYAPTGAVSITNVVSVNPIGSWNLSTIALNNGDSASGAPINSDFFVFTPAGDFNTIPYASAVEVELFSFTSSAGCNISLDILPSAGQTARQGTLNIGSYYSVLGFTGGIGTNHFNAKYNMVASCSFTTDTDNDGIVDNIDLDDDNDGIIDTVEDAQLSADADGDGIPNRLDSDSDNDGITDVIEAGGPDPDNNGKIGTGMPVTNTQGVPLLANNGNGLTLPDTDNDTKPNPYDTDSDNDGISDATEGSIDTDSDGKPNYIDTDSDADGISDAVEGTTDTDNDGKPNYIDTDADSDGIPDVIEGVTDSDADGKPNYIDTDSDGDNIPDVLEGITDTDKDTIPDYLDNDSDNDGVPDTIDQCRLVFANSPTGCPVSITNVQIKILLQGALFDSNNGLMRDDLRAKGLIPNKEPYTTMNNQRFAHKGSGGNEAFGTSITSITGNNAIVDWVFIELRDATNPANVVVTKAALLQRDGDVVEAIDGISPLTFMYLTANNFYVAVKHRNHLGAMTATPVNITNGVIDFTTMSNNQLWNTNNIYDGYEQAVINLNGTNKKALWAGNADGNNKVKYFGPTNDQTTIFSQVVTYSANNTQLYNYDFVTPIYQMGDINLDGKVKYRGTNNDSNYIFNNIINLYQANASLLYNYDLLIEQIP